ncbi:hypothetical protein F2Q69_00038566 [Brassica cretica]|uniref:Uncharacterized protein n=1 Tax=Brassica cretica TaxID=69181 RepID=A0A8S9SEI4_BRACR|nr:hypothetical protein F2Q69_00038566 [Brassica cretica]
MGTRRRSSKVAAEGGDRGKTEETADRRRRGGDALHSGEPPRRNWPIITTSQTLDLPRRRRLLKAYRQSRPRPLSRDTGYTPNHRIGHRIWPQSDDNQRRMPKKK